MEQGGTIFLKTENVVLDYHFVRAFQAKPGRYVKLSVKDNGAGMDAETQERIFEPFFTTKAIGKGTGLGLDLVKQIVEKVHDGRVFVTSQVGVGSTFGFELPLAKRQAAGVV